MVQARARTLTKARKARAPGHVLAECFLRFVRGGGCMDACTDRYTRSGRLTFVALTAGLTLTLVACRAQTRRRHEVAQPPVKMEAPKTAPVYGRWQVTMDVDTPLRAQ